GLGAVAPSVGAVVGAVVSPAAVAVGAVVVVLALASGRAARTMIVGFSFSACGLGGGFDAVTNAASSDGFAIDRRSGGGVEGTGGAPVPTAPTRITLGSTLFIIRESSAPGFTWRGSPKNAKPTAVIT